MPLPTEPDQHKDSPDSEMANDWYPDPMSKAIVEAAFRSDFTDFLIAQLHNDERYKLIANKVISLATTTQEMHGDKATQLRQRFINWNPENNNYGTSLDPAIKLDQAVNTAALTIYAKWKNMLSQLQNAPNGHNTLFQAIKRQNFELDEVDLKTLGNLFFLIFAKHQNG